MHNQSSTKKSIFLGDDGRNYFITFALISSLFFLWGFCNGLIDLMDKHFQSTLSLTKAESSLVQFANYMGYFCMAIPAGLLAKRFGTPPAWVDERLAKLSTAELEDLSLRLFDTQSIEELFGRDESR